MLSQLRLQRDQIAQEAFSGADIKNLLTNTFPFIVRELVGFVDKFVPTTPAIVLSNKQNEFLREINKHAYLDIAPLAAYVPEGLNVTYYKYSSELLIAAMHACRILSGATTAYSTYLSQIITNNDAKLSTTSFEKAYTELAGNREKINAALGACFQAGSTRTDRNIGQVIDRNADWEHVFRNTENMSNLMNGVDRKALNKKAQECKELLEKIIAKIGRNEFDGMSPEAIRNLADGAYQMASELEFYSVVYYKVLAYTQALNRTIDHFNRVFAE